MNYGKYYSEGESKINQVEDYTSHNTKQLNIEETKELLLKLSGIRCDVLGEKQDDTFEP